MKITLKSSGLKSLVKAAEGFDPSRSLKSLKSDMMKYVKGKLTQETFSTAAHKKLAQSISIDVHGERLDITVKDKAWTPYVGGQKAGQMTWLTKAKAPIPIVTESGKVIFRSATPKSMASGKWMHPGRAPFNIMERASHEVRAFLNGHLYQEFQKQLRRAIR